MSPHASVNGQAPRRRPHPAQPGGPGAAYGRHVGPCEALRTPLPSTDALDTLFTLRVASQRRDSTAKALAEPLLGRRTPLLGAGGTVLDRCKPCCSLPSAEFRPIENAAISLTAITYFPDEFPISHNLRNSQLSHPRRTRLAESGEFQQSRMNFCEFKQLHSSRNSS